MVNKEDLLKLGVVTLFTVGVFISIISVTGIESVKYPLPTEKDVDTKYNLQTRMNMEVTINQAKFNGQTFSYETRRSSPTGLSLSTVLKNLKFSAIAGAKNVVVTQELSSSELDQDIRKRIFYGNLAEGDDQVVKFSQAGLSPGSYTLTYELSQSCSLVDLYLDLVCDSDQTVVKTFEVPEVQR